MGTLSSTLLPSETGDGVRVTRGLVYGSGLVGFGRPGGPVSRDLRLDLYAPEATAEGLRPAVVLAFGGAFHRGTREDDTVAESGGGRNTPIAAYARWLAGRGYVAASIDYRLVPEDPVPGDTPVIGNPDAIPTSRVSVVRQILGLPPATTEILWRGMEAATDDMAAAFRFVVANAAAWGIDPARIAVGGFSAGARNALNAAFGEGIGAAAVVSLSGFMAADDLARLVRGASGEPACLLIAGEHDLDYVQAQYPVMTGHFASVAGRVESALVAGATHFYPIDAPLAGSPDCTVGDRVAAFLDRNLHPAP